MANIYSLRAEKNNCNAKISNLESKLKKLKKRKSGVEDVKKSLKSVVERNVNDVNDKIRSTAQKLEASIEYSEKEGLLDAIFSGKQEGSLSGDGYIAPANSELQRELDNINSQIGETESNLTNTKNRLKNIKVAITAEERRLWEESRKK